MKHVSLAAASFAPQPHENIGAWQTNRGLHSGRMEWPLATRLRWAFFAPRQWVARRRPTRARMTCLERLKKRPDSSDRETRWGVMTTGAAPEIRLFPCGLLHDVGFPQGSVRQL